MFHKLMTYGNFFLYFRSKSRHFVTKVVTKDKKNTLYLAKYLYFAYMAKRRGFFLFSEKNSLFSLEMSMF